MFAMAQAHAEVFTRLLRVLSDGNDKISVQDGADFSQALTDLAERMERSAEIMRELVQAIRSDPVMESPALTPREYEILTHLAGGRSNAEIAKATWVSENTVKFHIKNIFRKLGVRDRGQAMMMARAMLRRLDPSAPA
jgi:DNA-binding NarL/FixJ family response regulator